MSSFRAKSVSRRNVDGAATSILILLGALSATMREKNGGDFPRALDWGLWSPERSDLHLDSGRSLTQEFMSAVERGDQVHAIRVFRDQHRDATLKEAREAFLELSAKL